MIAFHPTQEAAIDSACFKPFSLISGGAGVGKTTIIDAIAKRLTALGETVALCAFAGKAAARLTEATGKRASTIHRLLGWNGEDFTCQSLSGSSVIVDEASMVCTQLLAQIVKRSPKRLILVGDDAQLPPVGSGQPFHDILSRYPDVATQLTHCFRQSEAVYRAATAIRNGRYPVRRETSLTESWEVRDTGDAQSTHDAILGLVRSGDIDVDSDIILCPRNGVDSDLPCTVKSLNSAIVDIVNPRVSGERFVPGDRVINTRNVASSDVWNGTTGTVHSVDSNGSVHVELDVQNQAGDDIVCFDKPMRKHLELAYALSVHKSQGSQYRKVVVVTLNRDRYRLLDRALVYTAVTRTKNNCLVVGEVEAFEAAIDTRNSKRTILQELM